MTPIEAIKFFGSNRRLASALGVDPSSVSKWVAAGKIPAARQVEIERLTSGALAADPEASASEKAKQERRSAVSESIAKAGAAVDAPCERCGARPAFLITWSFGRERYEEMLCAQCDEDDMRAFKEGC